MPRARVIRYLRNQLGDNYDRGDWQNEIDSSLSDDENIRILGEKINSLGLGRREYSYQDIQRMNADELAQRSGVPISRQYDQTNLLQSSGNIMTSSPEGGANIRTPSYRREGGYIIAEHQPFEEEILGETLEQYRLRKQKERNLRIDTAKNKMILERAKEGYKYETGAAGRKVLRAIRGLVPRDTNLNKKITKTMGQTRGRILPGIKIASKGLTYGYQNMPNRNPVGRPRGKYKHFIPGVGFVPVQQYRAYLRKVKAQRYAQMDAEQMGQQVNQQQIEQAPQQEIPRTPWSKTVDFSRKDFNLMRQDENLNLLRDMRSQQEYEYTDVNMISGEAVKKRKVMDMGFF